MRMSELDIGSSNSARLNAKSPGLYHLGYGIVARPSRNGRGDGQRRSVMRMSELDIGSSNSARLNAKSPGLYHLGYGKPLIR